MSPPATQALVLAGHGSHHDPRAADPVHAHADRIRERGGFDAVRTAFWKEQPSLAEVLATVAAEMTYVVPVMAGEGYFTDRVFPRELGLEADRADGHGVRYTPPVGTHERVVDVVLDRVEAVLHSGVPLAEVGLALVGHGTERHAQSATATEIQVNRLRALDRFEAVEPLYLDQAPRVGDLPDTFDADDVVVVPHFVADGGHVRRDVPAALGLGHDGEPFGGPWAVDGKRVWYTHAVGTAPGLTDVILERAAEAGGDLRVTGANGPGDLAPAERAFSRWLDAADPSPSDDRSGTASIGRCTRGWGELAITVDQAPDDGRRYVIRHREDMGHPAAELDHLATPAAVREYTGTDGRDNHRPLRTTRDLPGGWLAEAADAVGVVRFVRAVYPASIDHWYRHRADALDVTGFTTVVERQAGRYRDLDALDRDTLAATIEATCGDCVRRPAWTDERAPDPNDGGFPCPEPCSFLLEAARSFADVDRSRPTGEAVDPSVPPAAFDRRGNRYRARFRQALEERNRDRTQPHPTP